MMHPDVGHKWGSYYNFILAFLTNVTFGSSMPLATGIGWVYLALGWGTLVYIKFLNDGNPTLLESRCDARRLE